MWTPLRLPNNPTILQVRDALVIRETLLSEEDRTRYALPTLPVKVYTNGIMLEPVLDNLPEYYRSTSVLMKLVDMGMVNTEIGSIPPVAYVTGFISLIQAGTIITLNDLLKLIAVIYGPQNATWEEAIPGARDITEQLVAFTPVELTTEAFRAVITTLTESSLDGDDALRLTRSIMGFDWSAADIASPGISNVLYTLVDDADGVMFAEFAKGPASAFIADWFRTKFLPAMGRFALLT